MMLSRLWVLLLLLSYSFSVHAYSFGYTPNVAISGLEWTMTPTYLGADGIGGMDVSGVTYKYTPIKNKEDDYVVTLENDKVGGGYHNWHCENTSMVTSSRVLTWLFYFNDVTEGGETELLHYSMRVKPKAGRLIIFPAYFTHTHRGNPPISNNKYIATGWYHLS